MQSGNFAEAQLRALIDVAAVAAGAHRLEEVLELAAERSLWRRSPARRWRSRGWDTENGTCTRSSTWARSPTGEERFPAHEVYSDRRLSPTRPMREGEHAIASIDDPIPTSQRELLRQLGKESSLAVPMISEGEPWGGSRSIPRRVRHAYRQATRLPARDRRPARRRGPPRRAVRPDRGARLHRLADRRGEPARGGEGTRGGLGDPAGPGSPALVLCDIDDLKRVNDQGGHEAGDRALCGAAEALVQPRGGTRTLWSAASGATSSACCCRRGRSRMRARSRRRRAEPRAAGGERISCGVAARAGR